LLGLLVLAISITSNAQNWNLSDVAYRGALDAKRYYDKGGEEAVTEAIKFCHSSISVKTVFNAVTARCFSMDMTGTLLFLNQFKDKSAKPKGYLIEDGSYIGRNTPYLLLVPKDELDAVTHMVRDSVLEAAPELRSILLPKAIQH